MELSVFLKYFYELSKIPLRYYRECNLLLKYGELVYDESNDEEIQRQFQESGENFCYQMTSGCLIYGFLRLKEPREFLFFGPVTREKDLNRLVLRLSEIWRCPAVQRLWDYCRSLPVFKLQTFREFLQTAYTISVREGFCEKAVLFYLLSNDAPNRNLTPQEAMVVVRNQSVERQLLGCIEYGRVEEVRNILQIHMQGSTFPEYNLDLLRSYKDVFIVTIALCSRAAIRGGMDYDAAIAVTDRLIEQAERMDSPSEIDKAINQMMMYYVGQVAAIRKFSETSSLVQKTVSYICAHLTESLNINSIADELHQNPSYLSHHFKEQTGFSIKNYIVHEKIEEAKRLLESSDLSLLEIAGRLNFSSQQYFQSVFKKTVGCTPTEYRKKR